MKQEIKLGVVCLVRNTFDYIAAEKLYENALLSLETLNSVKIAAVQKPIMDVEESLSAGKFFANEDVDAIAVVSGTFHLGHLALNIKKLCDKPLLLWAFPELPYNGGKIRLNSVCGVNLNASNLVKSGITDFTYHIGERIDENFVDAIRMIVALKNCRMGLLGYYAQGFFNVGVDELSTYGKFGVLVDHFELSALWDEKADENDVARYKARFESEFTFSGSEPNLAAQKTLKAAVLTAKFKAFMDSNGLNVLAVRCWPEFAAGFGIAPCASMSMLQSEGYLLSCEGDIDCALTMVCHKAVGAETPYMADISQVNIEKNHALLWHCGVAPCNLACTREKPTLDSYHAGGKGMTAGFVLKSGRIEAVRLDSIGGKYRLFHESGEAVDMDKMLSGTYAKVQFDSGMKPVLDKVVYGGLAHHVSVVYGDFKEAFKIFARLKGIEVL